MSDRLEGFEKQFMKIRNWMATAAVKSTLWFASKSLKLIKFVPSSSLVDVKETVIKMEAKVKREETHRNKLTKKRSESGYLNEIQP